MSDPDDDDYSKSKGPGEVTYKCINLNTQYDSAFVNKNCNLCYQDNDTQLYFAIPEWHELHPKITVANNHSITIGPDQNIKGSFDKSMLDKASNLQEYQVPLISGNKLLKNKLGISIGKLCRYTDGLTPINNE